MYTINNCVPQGRYHFATECEGHVPKELHKAILEALKWHYKTMGELRLREICGQCRCKFEAGQPERTMQNILDSGNLEFSVVV